MTTDAGQASRPGIDHFSVAVLGLLTIIVYGAWYYSFGVLLDPILADTGWRESTTTLAFSVGVVVNGFASLAGGRLLDRVGSRVVFLIGGLGGGTALAAVSVAPNTATFVAAAALATGLLGGFGFYHITMTTAVRLNPDNGDRAIAVLTIWGAFASFIYLPLTAALVERLDWRVTVRVLAVMVAVAFLSGAALLRPVRATPVDRPVSLGRIVASTVSRPDRRRFTIALSLGWIAMSTILVYQVPVMTAAGLPLGLAASLAGLRGLAQLGGRIPLGPIVARLGSIRSMSLALTAISVSGIVLAVAGHPVPAVTFALLAGFGIGAMSPLQGMVVGELFDRESLGATMGAYGLLGMGGGAAGPLVAGVLADVTGDRRWATAIIAASAAVAAVLANRISRAATMAEAARSE